MKITIDRNLAFDDQPTPLTLKEVGRRVRARKARKPNARVTAEMRLPAPATGQPEVELERRAGGADVVLRFDDWRPGRHVFPPGLETHEVESMGDRKPKVHHPLATESSLPDHLPRRVRPRGLPKKLVEPPHFRCCGAERDESRGFRATRLFLPDDRRVFNDTAYPWSTCGRTDTPRGQATGVMVGPRHLLTVSHTIRWNDDDTAGFVRFRPSFFDTSAPFGDAWGTRVYFKKKVRGPNIDFIESMFDYAVVVLNWRIGDVTGWMGSRGYTDSWDGGEFWSHIGYPGDLTSGRRPTFENAISLDGAWWQFDSHEAMSHRADVWRGQSGGPFFGWWAGEVGPRVVSVQSSERSGSNHASGGQDMVDLILKARDEHP